MTKITVKKLLPIKEGKKKDGTMWKRYCVLATDGKYYASFTELPNDLIMGSWLDIEAELGQDSTSMNIKSIKEHGNPAPEGQASAYKPKTEQQIGAMAEARLKLAIEILNKTMPEAKGFDFYDYLVAETMQTMRSERYIEWEREKIAKGLR